MLKKKKKNLPHSKNQVSTNSHSRNIYKMIYLFSEVNVFVKPPIQSLTLAISPCLMDLLVWTYEHAVYQRFIRSSWRPNVCQSSRRDSVSEITFSTVHMLHMLHLRQEYVLKIQSNIFIVLPEMEEYWFIQQTENQQDFGGTLSIAPHQACMLICTCKHCSTIQFQPDH